MTNKKVHILWCAFLFSAAIALYPLSGFAEEEVIIPGMIEVEENHLYMIPIGTDDGVKKGDTIAVVRGDKKIADNRLISVLSDN